MDLKEKRRQDILNAAHQVFGDRGFHKGTIEDIAIKANIGKGTVYEYFDSKQEIFEEMILEALSSYTDRARMVVDEKKTTEDKLRALMSFNIDFVQEKSMTIEKAFFGFENISKDFIPSLMRLHQRIFEFIESLVAEGIETGQISSSYDPALISKIIVNISYGFNNGNKVINCGRSAESKELVKLLIDVLFKGLKNS